MESSSLQQSFLVLKEYFLSSSRQNNATSSPAQLVIFAENAFKEGHSSLASECLQLYFSLNPPTNQFLIRAHLCQALTAASANNAEPEENLQKSVESIVTAVEIAKKSECYYFLVHNASVLLWQICRPYHKPGWMGTCVAAWQSVARAQEHCKEEDHRWRLDVLLALLQSQVDAGLREEAVKTSHSAMQLARKRVPERLLEVLKLHMLCGLGEGRGVEKEMKLVPEFSIFVKLYKLKRTILQSTVKHGELESELRRLLEAMLVVKETSRKTPGPNKSLPLSPESKATLLLEIAQVCIDEGLLGLCGECVAAIPGVALGARLDLLRHTVTSQLSLLNCGHPSAYSRAAVEVREQTIAQLENCLIAAQRLGDQELVQYVGVILWRVCLPLLQPSLRTRLSHTLTTLASALEQVDSLLHGLRCSVHMELAKVCADQNQLQTALKHVNKARELDSACEWSEQLRRLGERLQLRSELYVTPPSPLQQATQILEQVGSSSDCGSRDEMRVVLVKVGTLLAPSHFRVAIGDKKTKPSVQTTPEQDAKDTEESDRGREEGGGEGGEKDGELVGESLTSVLSGDSEFPGIARLKEEEEEGEARGDRVNREKWYDVMKDQVQAYKEDIGTDEDADRCMLWANLAKLGRKSEAWDVALVAAKFCLIYDDKRWKVESVKAGAQSSKTGSKNKLRKTSSVSVNRSRIDASTRTQSSTAAVDLPASVERDEGRRRGQERWCRELVRTLAKTHCIHAECAVYQLRECGYELGHGISPPPRDRQQQSETTQSDTVTVVWPGQLSSDAYASFLRAAELGCTLREPWLVANAVTYLCNYSSHLLQTDKLSVLVPVFQPLLASVVAVREHDNDSHIVGDDVVCHLSTILAGGLVQIWMPLPPDPATMDPSVKTTGGRKSGRGTGTGKKKGGGGGGGAQLQVSPDAGPALNEALEVCERGLAGGSEVTLTVRATLLAVWVQCKQLLQQPIPSKTLGVDKDTGDTAQCRTVVAVEMLSLMGNKIWDFPDCPSLTEAFELLSVCEWSDVLLELELLTRIARLALLQKSYSLVSSCSNRASQSVQMDRETARGREGRRKRGGSLQRERELLSCISSLYGQALVAGGEGKVVSARVAMDAFLLSAKYGRDAGSYQCSLEASQHYWNTCQKLIDSPLERQVTQQPLTELITILTSFLPKRTTGTLVKEEDLQLYVAMYNIVFQVYIDKGEWEEGLKAIEEAMWATPRTIHRDLAEHKLIFKSKMGKTVDGDMIRFQDDPEEERARLWYSAACNATSPQLQLTAFQKAIDTLASSSHTWQKVDYILAFSEWLYTHQFPVEEALSHLQWALALLLGIGEEEGERGEEAKRGEEGEEGEGGMEGGQSRPTHSVRVLDKVMRVHVMMAQMHGRGSRGHRESCLAALAYCSLIWKATVESYSMSLTSSKSDVQLPSSVQEWTDFTLTDGFRVFIESTNSESSINTQSIKTPALTCCYLATLSTELCACGLHALALPVETLRLLVTDCLIQSTPASQLVHLRLVSLCAALGAQTGREEHRKQAGTVYLNAEDLAQSLTEIWQYQQKQVIVEGNHSKTHPPPVPPPPPPPVTNEKTVLREVWVEEAAILVEQGQFQAARELLKEATLSAQVFGDGHVMGRILMIQATLAAAEKQVEECIHCVCETQNHPMSLDQWENGMLLLLTVAESHPTHQPSCLAVVEEAVSSLHDVLLDGNHNEKTRIAAAHATLCAKLAAGVLLDSPDHEKNMDELEYLSEEMCVHTANLLHMGRRETATRVMLDHAKVLRRSATSSQGVSYKASLLKAVELLQGAVNMLQSVLEDALSLCPLSEGLYLPEEGLLIEAQLQLADTLLVVTEEHMLEERRKRTQQQQKSCIEKMIDDYVRESPQHNSAEELWNTVASIAAERALATLTSIYTFNTVQSHTQLQAKCVYGIGRALLLLSEHTSPDPPCQWWERHGSGTMSNPEDNKGDDAAAMHLNRHSALSMVMRKEEASKAEIAENESIQYLSKASQSLGQALNLALKCGNKEIAEMASLKIVDICGTYDAVTAALHLALYQSCVASRYLHRLLCQVQADTSESKLAALLHQQSELHRTHLSHPSSSSPLPGAVTAELDNYMCWQRLKVNEDHLDLLRNFPPHFRFLVLQHSEEKSQLYVAYIIPPQPPPSAPKKGQPPLITVSEVPVVSRVKVSARDRERLMKMVDSCKRLQGQQLLKGATPPSEYEMSLQFDKIRDMLDGYLSSALEPISRALQEEKSNSGLTVIILADFDLLQLPLEMMSLLQFDCVKAVARDFSLQMLCHRIKNFLFEDEDAGTMKKDKFHLQPSFLQANTTNFRYILDPRCELNTEGKPSQMILSQINAFPKITSKWIGHGGETIEAPMSPSQWYSILKQCSGFLFFGSERLLAHFSPRQLTSLSMQDCSIAVVVDHMQTPISSLTQSELDIVKSGEELQTEQSVQTASLLSLMGVDCLISRQWHSTMNTATDTMCSFIKQLLSEGVGIADMMWREVKEGQQRGEQISSDSGNIEEVHVQSKEASVYNSVVYGLPHLTLVPPDQ